MAKKQLNQMDALRAILKSGRRYTLTQLVQLVAKKTKRTVTAPSITVRLSQLRAEDLDISTYRGSASRAKDGSAQYQLV